MKSGMLKILRSNYNISQKDFAKAIGVSQQTIASWEVGRTEPSNDWLKAIADYFDVSIDYLLGRKTANYSPPLSNDKKSQLTNKFLSDEQSSLLKKYDALADDGRQLMQSLLNSLLISHPKKSSAVIQGNNKFVNGSGETNYLAT